MTVCSLFLTMRVIKCTFHHCPILPTYLLMRFSVCSCTTVWALHRPLTYLLMLHTMHVAFCSNTVLWAVCLTNT